MNDPRRAEPSEIIHPDGTRQHWPAPPTDHPPVRTTLEVLASIPPATGVTLVIAVTSLTVLGVLGIVAVVAAAATALATIAIAGAVIAAAIATITLALRK